MGKDSTSPSPLTSLSKVRPPGRCEDNKNGPHPEWVVLQCWVYPNSTWLSHLEIPLLHPGGLPAVVLFYIWPPLTSSSASDLSFCWGHLHLSGQESTSGLGNRVILEEQAPTTGCIIQTLSWKVLLCNS